GVCHKRSTCDAAVELPAGHRNNICRSAALSLKDCVDGRELPCLRCCIRVKVVPDAKVAGRGPGSEALIEDDGGASAVFILDPQVATMGHIFVQQRGPEPLLFAEKLHHVALIAAVSPIVPELPWITTLIHAT